MGTTTDSTCLVLVSGTEPTEGPEAARFFYSTGALQVPVTRGLLALQKYLSLQPAVHSLGSCYGTFNKQQRHVSFTWGTGQNIGSTIRRT